VGRSAIAEPSLDRVGGALDAIAVDSEAVGDLVEIDLGDRARQLLRESAEAVFETIIGHVCNGDTGGPPCIVGTDASHLAPTLAGA
jgi:hypothetical protein